MHWSHLPAEEIERRRLKSLQVLKEREYEEFDQWYQEQCDRHYWTQGQCCAGCDHWNSANSLYGQCLAAGIVSGEEVMRSLGITFSSYPYQPGYPMKPHDHYCSKFSDQFDWSTLEPEYLSKIGAMRNEQLKSTPSRPIAHHRTSK